MHEPNNTAFSRQAIDAPQIDEALYEEVKERIHSGAGEGEEEE